MGYYFFKICENGALFEVGFIQDWGIIRVNMVGISGQSKLVIKILIQSKKNVKISRYFIKGGLTDGRVWTHRSLFCKTNDQKEKSNIFLKNAL